jgi:uncharacterized protein
LEIREKMSIKYSSSIVSKKDIFLKGRISSGYEFVEINGILYFNLEMECSRCLKFKKNDYSSNLSAIFTKENDDEALNISKFNIINIEGIVADRIIDSMNMKYLCSLDCLGLCLICGMDRNINNCKHKNEGNKKNLKDNPFSSLNELDLKVE